MWLPRRAATCSGVPVAMTSPPPAPPSGPRSMTQSADLITSRLCSITITVLPLSTSPLSTWRSLRDVFEVQARRRLVEHVDAAAVRPTLQLGRELDALRLAAREGRRALAEPHVAEADIDEGLQVAVDRRDRLEELGRLAIGMSSTSAMFLPL